MSRARLLTGSKANRSIYTRLRALRVSESLTVTRAEWKGITPPTDTLRYSKTNRGQFSVQPRDDGTGWLICRLKEPKAQFPKTMQYGPVATRPIYERLRGLQVGEEFTLQLQDWKVATSPTDSIGKSVRYRESYKVRELEGGKGWVISRIK